MISNFAKKYNKAVKELETIIWIACEPQKF